MSISPLVVNALWFLLIVIGLGVALAGYVLHWLAFDRNCTERDDRNVSTATWEDDWQSSDWKLRPH